MQGRVRHDSAAKYRCIRPSSKSQPQSQPPSRRLQSRTLGFMRHSPDRGQEGLEGRFPRSEESDSCSTTGQELTRGASTPESVGALDGADRLRGGVSLCGIVNKVSRPLDRPQDAAILMSYDPDLTSTVEWQRHRGPGEKGASDDATGQGAAWQVGQAGRREPVASPTVTGGEHTRPRFGTTARPRGRPAASSVRFLLAD